MKVKIFTMVTFLSISILCSFNSLAGQKKLINAEYEKSEIEALEDEMIRKINESGPRSELSRDVTENDIDFGRAYRVYANSDLFNKRTDNAEEIKEILQNSHYIWQIPIFIENDTVLVDIYKNTEINDDVPDDIKDKLRETLGQWQVGVIYVYDNRTVDFQESIRESLVAVELNADEYVYEFVSGLPGIKYPVAVVFDQNDARYIIPAESETARAFEEGTETMQYTASPSNATDSHNKSNNGFPVYNFEDVSKASRNASALGLGGSIGISSQNADNHSISIAILIIVSISVGIIVSKRLTKKNSK
ncbi:hypothetical protein ADH76_01040 [Enterocloster clostridioformis]|nr:hypothetical protein A4V08_03365 [Lachnoclostridium sp. YL32]NDO27625.1 hypothetical protein [Enterocloster clostridioformis]OXE70083.1 hypothetical protein ADH76_01040 [Enterocloster clostridioformis]QQR00226.1 hypothetical protein I5Q83_31275 [Enterocloster clostridioformis]